MKKLAQGIILAGVHQWRPSVFEGWIPRTLIPIANRPLVDYPLAWMQSGGIGRVEICANSDTHALRHSIQQAPLVNEIEIGFYEDVFPRGPAGCIADAVRGRDVEDTLVIDGTVIPNDVDFSRLIDSHQQSGAALTVAVTRHEGQNGSDSRFSPTGIYIFARSAIEQIQQDGYEDIKEMLIPRLHERGLLVRMFELAEPPIRVTSANGCFVATRFALRKMYESNTPPRGYLFLNGAIAHQTAEVDPSARIEGPCLIGPRSRIASGATIIGPTTIGNGVHIQERAIVCRSLLWDGVAVGRDTFLDRCIFTHHARVEDNASLSQRIVHHAERIGRKGGRKVL